MTVSVFEGEVFEPETGEVIEDTPPSAALERQALKETIQDVDSFVQKSKKRVKRTERQMIAGLGGSALKEATYVADRVRKLEDKISELMGSVSQAARELILKDYPHLNRY